jgi:hypothetical protein
MESIIYKAVLFLDAFLMFCFFFFLHDVPGLACFSLEPQTCRGRNTQSARDGEIILQCKRLKEGFVQRGPAAAPRLEWAPPALQ